MDPTESPSRVDLEIRRRLRRTWPVFFARFGKLTPIQRKAVPPLLAGRSVSMHAPTATGKTEAALAPLLERALESLEAGGPVSPVIYLSPTRALANDLFRRLQSPLRELGLVLGMRTGDRHGVTSHEDLPHMVLLTPETLDSLLARNPRAFLSVRAVVVDELHLLDGSPRGDQLRVLLERLRRILSRGGAAAPPSPGPTIPGLRSGPGASGRSVVSGSPDQQCQFVALSATLRDPARVVRDYWPEVEVVRIEGQRVIDAEDVAWGHPGDATALVEALRRRRLRKALAFANTRRDAELLATALREAWSYRDRVFLHYSNLDRREREAIEQAMGEADVGVTVATTTLELGIDIGDVEAVILFGPPPSVSSYLQRIGRGSRRQQTTPVLRIWRDEQEALLFELIHRRASFGLVEDAPRYPIAPGVIAQQIGSLLYQRRRLSTSIAFLAELFRPFDVDEDTLEAIVDVFVEKRYLAEPRPGLLQIQERLEALIDRGEIHATIRGSATAVEVVDVDSGRIIGRLDAPRPSFTLAGRSWETTRRAGGKLYARVVGQAAGGGFRSPKRAGGALRSMGLARDLRSRLYGVRVDELPYHWDAEREVLSVFHYLGPAWAPLLHAALARRVFLGERVDEDADVLNIVCPDDPTRHLEGAPVFPLPESGSPVGEAKAHGREAEEILSVLSWDDASPAGDEDRWAFLAPSPVRSAYQRRRRIAEMEAYGYAALRFCHTEGA